MIPKRAITYFPAGRVWLKGTSTLAFKHSAFYLVKETEGLTWGSKIAMSHSAKAGASLAQRWLSAVHRNGKELARCLSPWRNPLLKRTIWFSDGLRLSVLQTYRQYTDIFFPSWRRLLMLPMSTKKTLWPLTYEHVQYISQVQFGCTRYWDRQKRHVFMHVSLITVTNTLSEGNSTSAPPCFTVIQ